MSYYLPPSLYHFILFSLFTNMDMKRQINMCLFMSMLFISIQIKFDIDINNDELLKTTWKYKEKKLIVIGNV
jgi:hypothetical protein